MNLINYVYERILYLLSCLHLILCFYLILKNKLKNEKQNFEDLYEFLKLMNEELRYMNEIEDVELNRDWSQPNKLNSDELFKYKKVKIIYKIFMS